MIQINGAIKHPEKEQNKSIKTSFLSLKSYVKKVAVTGIIFSLSTALYAAPISIPGTFGGKGKQMFEKTRFGKGIKIQHVYENVSYPGVGNINPAQGTIEVWLKVLEDVKPENGHAWRCILTAPPLQNQLDKFNTQLGLIITIAHGNSIPPSSMGFTMKDQESEVVFSKSLHWKAESEHYVVASWGERGMELYIDGHLVKKNKTVKKNYLSDFPSRLIFGNHPTSPTFLSHAVIDEVKISDIQRSSEYIGCGASSEHAPVADGNTLLLSHFDSSINAIGALTDWKKNISYATLRTPFETGVSSELNHGDIFMEDESVALDTYISNLLPSKEEFTIKSVVHDFHGKEVFTSIQNISLNGIKEAVKHSIPLEYKFKPGFYSVQMTLSKGGEVHAKSSRSFCLLDKALPPGNFVWGFEVKPADIVSFGGLKRMGISMIRAHGTYFWPLVEPEKGEFYWAAAKNFTEECRKYGMKIQGILGYTPLWAGTPPDNIQDFKGGKNYSKVMTWKERYRPAEIKEWENYISKTVKKNPGVKYWEIWNEPDWHLPQTAGFGFGGTTAQFFELMKSAYKTAKKANPESIIVFPGIACARGADANFVSELLKYGCLEYFDQLGLHPYGGLPFFKTQIELFKKHGYRGTVWQTEFIPAAFKNEPFKTRGKVLALEHVRHIVRMLPAGISSYNIQTLNHGHPTESYFSTALLFRKLQGLKFIKNISSNVYVFGNRERTVLIMWGKEAIEVYANVPRLTSTDHMGFSKDIELKNGSATFIPGDFLYVETAGKNKIDPRALSIKQALSEVLLPANGSFEEFEGDAGFKNFTPLKWKPSPYNQKGQMNLDIEIKNSGKAALLLERLESGDATGKIAVFQELPLAVRGRSFMLSAWMQTEKKSPNKGSASVLIWDCRKRKNYGSLTVSLNSPKFLKYSKEITIPEDAGKNIVISCSTNGNMFRAWFDDIKLEEKK